jgi:hypothetical protein
MPQGYYTIEGWRPSRKKRDGGWHAILHLPFGASLTDAEHALANLGKQGFYRIVQMQRVIWAQPEDGRLRLRKSHASSPANLDQMRAMFERTGGVYPVEEVRAARKVARQKRARRP